MIVPGRTGIWWQRPDKARLAPSHGFLGTEKHRFLGTDKPPSRYCDWLKVFLVNSLPGVVFFLAQSLPGLVKSCKKLLQAIRLTSTLVRQVAAVQALLFAGVPIEEVVQDEKVSTVRLPPLLINFRFWLGVNQDWK